MQRTIADARRTLEDLAPQLNPAVYAAIEGQIKGAERDAAAKASKYVADRYSTATTTGQAALTDLCAVRDEALALVAATQTGELTSREAVDRLHALQARQRHVARQHTDVTDAANAIAHVEDDPVGWLDSTIHAKYPGLRPNFDF